MNPKIRLLIVDDSYFIRKTLVKLLTQDDIEIIDTAANGKEGVEKIKLLNPDVVTMDIEMPILTGLEALKIVMEENPVPVIMVSTLTNEGANSTMEALTLGAVDFIAKKASFTELHLIQNELLYKIRSIAKNSAVKNQLVRKGLLTKMTKSTPKPLDSITKAPTVKSKTEELIQKHKRARTNEISIVCIGISTGGPAALQFVIPKLTGRIPVPIVIAQHMPPFFTKSLADRLNDKSELTVKEAEHGEKLLPGFVYFAPGGRQMTINSKHQIVISDEPKEELYKPSVNVLMSSIVDIYGGSAAGIIMTGMGHDGGIGFKKLFDAGGYIISQDVESCVVAGMPKTIIDMDIANEILPLLEIADSITNLFRNKLKIL